jgi:hypothetical protein
MRVSNMDVAVILRLVDQLSGPAKKAAESVKQLVAGLKQIQTIKGFESLQRQATAVSGAVKKISTDVNALSTAFGRLAQTSRSAMGSMAVSAAAQASTASQVRHLREMLAIQQQMMRNGARHGGVSVAGSLGGSLGYMMAGHRPMHSAVRGLEKAGDLESEMARLRILGFSSADQKRIIERARETSFSVPIFSQAEALKSFRELNYAFGDTHEALRALPEVAKSLAAMGPEVRDQAMSVVKSGELKNYIKTADDFHDWLESVHRTYQGTGGKVTPDMMLGAFKYARGALAPYDREFVNYYMPELVQELSTGGKGSGSRGGAGTALAAFKRMFVDQTFAKQYIPEWVRLGLIDPSKAVADKHGADKMKLLPGALYDQELAAKNPFEYMKKRLLPALQKDSADIDDAVQIVKSVAKLGGTDLAKQLIQLLVLQRKQMEKRVDLGKRVVDLEHSYDIQMGTFKLQWEALKEQATSLTQTTLTPLLPIVNSAMGGIRNFFIGLNKLFHDNPWLATAGVIGAGAAGVAVAKRLLGSSAGRVVAGAVVGAAAGNVGLGLVGGMLAGGGKAAIAATAAGTALGTRIVSLFIKGLGPLAAFAGLTAIKWDMNTPGQPLRETVRDALASLGVQGLKPPDVAYREWDGSKLGKLQHMRSPGDMIPNNKAWNVPSASFPYFAANVVGDADAPRPQGIWSKEYGPIIGTPNLGIQELIKQVSSQMPQIVTQVKQGVDQIRANWSVNIPAPVLEAPNVPAIGSPPPRSSDKGQKTIGPAPPGRQSSVNIGNVHVHVHGAGDPKKVAELVHQQFARAVNRGLSEGAYA